MIEHIQTQKMNAFYARVLEKNEMVAIAEHLAVCPVCHRLFQGICQERNDHRPATLNLSLERLFKHEHLDFDQLVALSDNNLDDEEREIINIHLRVCESCGEDVRSFLKSREQIDSASNLRFGPGQPAKLSTFGEKV